MPASINSTHKIMNKASWTSLQVLMINQVQDHVRILQQNLRWIHP